MPIEAGPVRTRLAWGLVALYAVLTLLCFIAGWFLADDAKGRFVFLQLPVALQAAAMVSLGWADTLVRPPPPVAYAVLWLAGSGIAYGLGWIFTVFVQLLRNCIMPRE